MTWRRVGLARGHAQPFFQATVAGGVVVTTQAAFSPIFPILRACMSHANQYTTRDTTPITI
jgi:hypothetical protein